MVHRVDWRARNDWRCALATAFAGSLTGTFARVFARTLAPALAGAFIAATTASRAAATATTADFVHFFQIQHSHGSFLQGVAPQGAYVHGINRCDKTPASHGYEMNHHILLCTKKGLIGSATYLTTLAIQGAWLSGATGRSLPVPWSPRARTMAPCHAPPFSSPPRYSARPSLPKNAFSWVPDSGRLAGRRRAAASQQPRTGPRCIGRNMACGASRIRQTDDLRSGRSRPSPGEAVAQIHGQAHRGAGGARRRVPHL